MGQLTLDSSAKMESLKTNKDSGTRTGISFPRLLYRTPRTGENPLRRGPVGDPYRLHRQRQRRGDFRTARRRSRRRIGRRPPPTSSPASISTARWDRPERETSVAQLVQRVVDTIAGWGMKDGYFKTPEDGENFRMELAHLMLTQKACFNSPVWFNVGVKEARGYGWVYDKAADRDRQAGTGRGAPAMLGLLHRLGEGFARIDSGPGQDRGHAVQVGLGHGHEPFGAARRGRDALGRRARLRAAFLHEGVRCLRGRHQVRRQDAPRGQDGDPQRGPSRHRALHLVQGQGREEGPHAGGGGLRRLARRRSLQLHLLPERQQFRARHRRIHGSRRRRTATGGRESVATRPAREPRARRAT